MSKSQVITWGICAHDGVPMFLSLRDFFTPPLDDYRQPDEIVVTRTNGERFYSWSACRERTMMTAWDRPRSAARLLYTEDVDTDTRRVTIRDLTADDWQYYPSEVIDQLRRDGWRNVPAADKVED